MSLNKQRHFNSYVIRFKPDNKEDNMKVSLPSLI